MTISDAYEIGVRYAILLETRSQRLNNGKLLNEEQYENLRLNVDEIAQGKGPEAMGIIYSAEVIDDKLIDITEEEELKLCQIAYETTKKIYQDVIDALASYYQDNDLEKLHEAFDKIYKQELDH